MIRPFESSIADANDIHGDVRRIEPWMRPHDGLWHRKVWEYLYIAKQFDAWSEGRSGIECLGFGCGLERVPFMLAAEKKVKGVLVTDRPEPMDCWSTTEQYTDGYLGLAQFAQKQGYSMEKISYRGIDMNHIPDHLWADFIWSTSSLEHLGSMDLAQRFIIESAQCLKPGGLAVHATEFNLSDQVSTRLEGPSVYFRTCDLEQLYDRCLIAGFELSPLNLKEYLHPYNSYVDPYPYEGPHLRVAFDGYVLTSIGISVRRIA